METSIFRRTPERQGCSWEIVQPYVLAVATSLVALALTRLLEPYVQRLPLVLFFMAVVLSAWFGGVRAGILSTALTVIFAETAILSERMAGMPFLEEAIPLIFYTVVAAAAVGLLTQLRSRTAILREKEAQLTDFMEAATVGLQWLAEDGTILWANRALADLLGCQPRECVGRKFQEFLADAGDAPEMFLRLAANERLKNHELRLRGDDGSCRTVLLDADVFWRDGRFIHARCFVRDITTRLRAEESLRKSEYSLRLAQRIGRIGSWEANLEKDTLEWSEETYRIFGCRPEGFVPTECGFFELVHPDDRLTVRRVADHALLHSKYYSVDYRVACPDGTERHLVQQARIVRNDDGKARQMIGTVQDITERRRAEQTMRELNEQLEARVQERTRQLEHANQELESFSYSISHDLRAPVRAINGFSQILREDHLHKMDAEMVRLFEVIGTNARRMGELIEDLLSFSKLDAHEFQPAPTDMKSLATLVAHEQIAAANSAALVRIGDLPVATVDESLFRQVFSNLIGNALKYSRGRSAPEIEVGARAEGGDVVFFVRDNGVGFDMRYAGKLFKVFQRLHKAEQFEGTGVGLAIVQRVVQRHGGRVWAEGVPGQGATFHFALPAVTECGARVETSGVSEASQDDALRF